MNRFDVMREPEKILIIRLSSIGDILLTTPLIRILKKRFPNSKIDFVIKEKFRELISHHPALDIVYSYHKKEREKGLKKIKERIRQQNYDIIFDIHKNFRSIYLRTAVGAGDIFKFKKFIVPRWLMVHFKINLYKKMIPVYQRYINSGEKLGIEYDDLGLDIYISESIRDKLRQQWNADLEPEKNLVIGIAPGAGFETKRWHAEGFRAVIEDLLATHPEARVLLFGNVKDRQITQNIIWNDHPRVFDVAGKYSLMETTAMMDYCKLVITNDSGLMHLASALKKKVVAIFGSTTEHLGFFPCNKEALIIQNNALKCRPCTHVGRKKCPKKHFKCMLDIQAVDVLNAAHLLINSGGN
ncbi:hypothetical protein GF337_03720 [candidate division KSB1 bacterium]|nr:hypothetical protein [candidate division KSB1 bacterium]